MTLPYKNCLFAADLFEDHGIKVDRAELLSLSIYINVLIKQLVTDICPDN